MTTTAINILMDYQKPKYETLQKTSQHYWATKYFRKKNSFTQLIVLCPKRFFTISFYG